MRRLIQKIGFKKTQSGLTRDQSTKIPSNPTCIGQSEEDIGLKTVCEAIQCEIDIVAVHGDGGNYEYSWTHPETKTFWLRDLLPRVVPKSRILSFGYTTQTKPPSSKMATEDIALHLLRDLSELRKNTKSENRKIIFLAHSFGVLILKGALIASLSSGFKDITASTHGIMFFGSPPDMSHGLGNLISATPANMTESSQLAAMMKDVEWLQRANAQYSALEMNGEFEVTYFLESPNDGSRNPQSRALQKNGDREKVIRMHKTHGMMIRFANADDEDFRKVEQCIMQMMKRVS